MIGYGFHVSAYNIIQHVDLLLNQIFNDALEGSSRFELVYGLYIADFTLENFHQELDVVHQEGLVFDSEG